MKYIIKSFFFLLTIAINVVACAQFPHASKLTHQDTLRGTNTPERAWWNVLTYAISVTPDYDSKTIHGCNVIGFDVSQPGANKKMQIDLQEPMQIDSVIFFNEKLNHYKRDGNVYIIDFGKTLFGAADLENQFGEKLFSYRLKIYFSGKPREAKFPPWDGGWIWKKDNQGRPWMSVACQGLGASVWYPCKDIQSDEPDSGALLSITVPDTLVAVGNGRLTSKEQHANGTTTWHWKVVNPINNYDIIPYIGKYVHWSDTYKSEETNKDLSLDFWVLDYNLEKAKKQFGLYVKPMLKAFEYWFGPYPFYEDGYKLVQSPHLGMEHQSAVAYGNHFENGYLGRDLSGSGWGLKWDYIIIHESGHEWFGNNITTKDIADMWVHEGFTMYSEVLFTEYYYGKKAGDEYLQGVRKNIANNSPIIGPYGVNKEGSSDMYNKGASLLHTIRQVINNDSVFRSILRGLNHDFYHQTVTTKQVETYFSQKSGIDLQKIFDQYLRTTDIPVLEYTTEGQKIKYRWANCVDGFAMPIDLLGTKNFWLTPTTDWQTTTLPAGYKMEDVNKNFYVKMKAID
ncbi:MAG: M1 family metallopeptidase [Chitinophagaceae bacterium]